MLQYDILLGKQWDLLSPEWHINWLLNNCYVVLCVYKWSENKKE